MREEMMIRKGDVVLDSLERWREHAGPKSPDQWTDHRSAKESARAWLDTNPPSIPPELLAPVVRHPDFGPIETWQAEPESLVYFDAFGGPANLDVLLTAEDEHGPFSVAIEAKADEPFGSLVHDAFASALERALEREGSNGIARIEQLAKAILGPRAKGRPGVQRIRYQLLTACAGAIAAALRIGADRTVLMIHEFRTARTETEKLRENQRDLVRFLGRLGVEEPGPAVGGRLLGPISVPGFPLFDEVPRLYVGKAVREVSGSAAKPAR